MVRERFGDIPLMVDANAAYTLDDADRLAALDAFGLMMIEQPLDYDDVTDHARLQRRLKTPICLDESIHSPRVGAGRDRRRRLPGRQHQAGPARRVRRVDRRARPVRGARRPGLARRDAGVGHRPRRTTSTCRRCRTSRCRATSRRAGATSCPIWSSPPSRWPPDGTIAVPTGAGPRRGGRCRAGRRARRCGSRRWRADADCGFELDRERHDQAPVASSPCPFGPRGLRAGPPGAGRGRVRHRAVAPPPAARGAGRHLRAEAAAGSCGSKISAVLHDPVVAASYVAPRNAGQRPPGRGGRRRPRRPPISTRLLADADARVRRRAALAIGRVGLGGGRARRCSAALAATAEPEVRQMAAFALGLLRDPSAAPALRAALGDASPLVQGRAAEALGALGDTASSRRHRRDGRRRSWRRARSRRVAPDDVEETHAPPVEAFRLGVLALGPAEGLRRAGRVRSLEPRAGPAWSRGGRWPRRSSGPRTGARSALLTSHGAGDEPRRARVRRARPRRAEGPRRPIDALVGAGAGLARATRGRRSRR